MGHSYNLGAHMTIPQIKAEKTVSSKNDQELACLLSLFFTHRRTFSDIIYVFPATGDTTSYTLAGGIGVIIYHGPQFPSHLCV